jgi:hypothetical protein
LARNPYAKDLEQAEQEIERGNSAVHMIAGTPIAPFFRFPDLQHTPQAIAYLGQRNIAIFSTEVDSRDFKMHKPEQMVNSVMSQLEKRHKVSSRCTTFITTPPRCFQSCSTSSKRAATKWCIWCRGNPLVTLPKYDEMLSLQNKLSSNNTPPAGGVVRTIGQ